MAATSVPFLIVIAPVHTGAKRAAGYKGSPPQTARTSGAVVAVRDKTTSRSVYPRPVMPPASGESRADCHARPRWQCDVVEPRGANPSDAGTAGPLSGQPATAVVDELGRPGSSQRQR